MLVGVQTSGKSKAVCFSSSAEESRYNSIYDGATDGGIRIVGLGRGQTFKAHCIAKKVRVYFNRRFQHMRFLQQIVYVQLLCVCSTEYCERACKMVPRSRLRVQAAAICSLELRFASAMYKREHIDRKCPVILNRKNNYLHAPTQHPTSSQISSTDERLRSKRNW